MKLAALLFVIATLTLTLGTTGDAGACGYLPIVPPPRPLRLWHGPIVVRPHPRPVVVVPRPVVVVPRPVVVVPRPVVVVPRPVVVVRSRIAPT